MQHRYMVLGEGLHNKRKWFIWDRIVLGKIFRARNMEDFPKEGFDTKAEAQKIAKKMNNIDHGSRRMKYVLDKRRRKALE